MAQVDLSKVSVDFDALLTELTTDLQQRRTWRDLLVSSTGTTLIEYMASIGVFNQYNIEMAFREAFLSKAVRDSSIYGIARMLGIEIGRKTAPIIEVELSNIGSTTAYILPKSKFAGPVFAYNTNQINIAANQTALVPLVVGEVRQVTFPASTTTYNEYIIGEPGFIIGNVRVSVKDNLTGVEELWAKTDSALWMHTETDKIYFESTLDDGDVSIAFGDGTFGAIPSINSTVIIEYVISNGTAHNTGLLGTTFTAADNREIVGTVKSVWEPGIDQKPSAYYKLYAPHMYKARNRAITKTDYISIILSRNDVAAVTVQAQRDLYPNDPMWMNTIRVCVLASGPHDTFGGSNPNPASVKWDEFSSWLQQKMGALIKMQRWNPTKQTIDVSVKVALTQNVDAQDVTTTIKDNIENLFKKDMYSLGKSIYLSDITEACRINGVDYVDIESPKSNIVPKDQYTYSVLGNLTINPFYSERTSLPTYRR